MSPVQAVTGSFEGILLSQRVGVQPADDADHRQIQLLGNVLNLHQRWLEGDPETL